MFIHRTKPTSSCRPGRIWGAGGEEARGAGPVPQLDLNCMGGKPIFKGQRFNGHTEGRNFTQYNTMHFTKYNKNN